MLDGPNEKFERIGCKVRCKYTSKTPVVKKYYLNHVLLQIYLFKFQTHVSENPAECEVAVSLHEGCRDYVDIYAQANLLTAKVIFFCLFWNNGLDSVVRFLDYSCPWNLFV